MLTRETIIAAAARYHDRTTAAAALGVHPRSLARAACRYGIRLQWAQVSPRNCVHETRVPHNRDPWKALAAAVIRSAISTYLAPRRSNISGPARLLPTARLQAGRFLEGDMWPFAEMIGLDPETNLAYRRWCRSVGLTAGARAGERV